MSVAMCALEDCDKVEQLRRGWCQKHYLRWKRTGDPLVMRKSGSPGLPGIRHPQWKGDGAGYAAMHFRLRALRGPATAHLCVDCGGPADQWSYTKDCPNEKSDTHYRVIRPYSTDPGRYVPRCFSCHTKFDHSAQEVP